MPADFSPFGSYLPQYLPPIPTATGPQPGSSDVPATGTGNWLTSGIMSGVHGAISEGARALQAGAQLVGADDTAESLADIAQSHYETEQSYARPDLEEHPWSVPGIAYNVARMAPMSVAALLSAAGVAAAAPELAGAGLIGGAGAMLLPAIGSNVQRQISETGELTSPGKAIMLGVPEAVVQGILPGKLESFFGKGILRGIAGSAAAQGGAAGATEAMTQMMGDPDRSFSDRASAVVNQALGGAGMGAIIGGAFGGYRRLVGKPTVDVTTGELDQVTGQALKLLPPPAEQPIAGQAPLDGLSDGALMSRLNTLHPMQTAEGNTPADYQFARHFEELQRRNAERGPTPTEPQKLLPVPEPGVIPMGVPLNQMSDIDLMTRINTLHGLRTEEGNTPADLAFRPLYEELQRRVANMPVESPQGQKLIGYVERMGAPPQDLTNLELTTKLGTLRPLVTGDPRNPADQAFAPLREEYLRRAAEAAVKAPAATPVPVTPAVTEPGAVEPGTPVAAHEPAAPATPTPVSEALREPAPGAVPGIPIAGPGGPGGPGGPVGDLRAGGPSAPEQVPAAAGGAPGELPAVGPDTEGGLPAGPPAAPAPILNFAAKVTQAAIKRGMAQVEALPIEAQAAEQQRLIDTINALKGKKIPAPLRAWAKAFDILTEDGKELREEFVPEQPVETPPGVAPEAAAEPPAAAEAPAAAPAPAAAGWRPMGPDEVFQPGRQFRVNVDSGQSEVFEPGATATPVADKTPIKTADDRLSALNGVQAEIAKFSDSPVKTQTANEAETLMKLLPNVEANPGLALSLNVRLTRLRNEVEAAAQRPGEYAASADLEPSPRAEATPAPMGNLDVKVEAARRALDALGVKAQGGLGGREDAEAALTAHKDWLADITRASGPDELREALAKDPEFDPEGEKDNLQNLTQISKPTRAKIDAYLAAQQSVLQELRAQTDSRARVVSARDGMPVSQLDADITDMHQRGVSATDALGHVMEHTADPEEAAIAAKLQAALPEGVKLGYRDNVLDKEGEYFTKQKTSMLYNAGNATATFLHEMAHAVYHQALEAGGVAAKAINGVYDQLKSKGDWAGITDAHEMLSEAAGNPVYRAFLKSQFVRGTSMWDRLIDAGRGFLGLDPRLHNAFDRIMSLGDDLIKERQQYPNGWVGPDSYARLADNGMGAAANGADQGRESTVQRLANAFRTGVSAIGFNTRDFIRKGALGWTDSYRMGQLYGDAIQAMRPYLESLARGEAREGEFYKASQMASNLANKLPEEGRELLHSVMADATFYGLDPQKPAPQDIQGNPGRTKLYQEIIDKWNQLKAIPGGEAAYEALRAKASADYHAVLTDRLQTVERAMAPSGYDAQDVFKTFDGRTDIHTDPTKTEKFFKDAVAAKVDALSKYRDQLAGQKATIGSRELPLNDAVKLQQTVVDAARKSGGASDDALKTLQDLKTQRDNMQANVGSINDVLKEVADRRDAVAKAPYFHLGRDGNYFVTAKLATDAQGKVDQEKLAQLNEHLDANGFHNIAVMLNGENNTLYTRMKTPAEMRELTRVMQDAQAKGLVSQEAKSLGAGEATQVFDSIAPAAMRRAVGAMIENRPKNLEGVDKGTTDQMNRAFGDQVADMQRTLLNMMAENSIGRVMARRANVQGFSKDMSESANYASQVMSRSLGRMTMADEVGSLTKQMADQVRDLNHTEPGTDRSLAASEAVGELMLRERLKSTYVPPTALDAIRHLSHTIHVGSSPAYFLTLMSQLATTSYPELAKTHGYGAAFGAFQRALPDALAVVKAITKGDDWNTAGITRDALEKDGLSQPLIDKVMGMVSRGVMGTAMYSTQMTEHSNLASVLHISPNILKAANALGLYSELIPRLVTGFAAHDLYNAKPYIEPRTGVQMTREQFIDRAINDSQGNWDASLNARQTSRGGMFGGVSPLINQFMGWQIRMTGKIYNEVRDMFNADTRPEATRWLISHAGATAMFAGTLGMPMLSVAASVYDQLMNWVTNRDDHDLTSAYRGFLSDTFGKDMGEIIARGLPRAVGMDFAHFGEATIVPGSSTLTIAFEKRKLEDRFRDWFKSMGGAGVGDISNVAYAARDMMNGDFLNGGIRMAPEFVKAPMEAFRLGQRGFVNNLNGEKLPITANGWDIAKTALGIDPGKEAEYQELAKAEAGLRTMRELNSSNIVRHLETAYMRGDRGMFNTWMNESQQWQRTHPGMEPPQASFGRELEVHMRQSAQAKGMGLPIGVTPRDIGARGALRYGNIPVQ